jgi:hypothetical protein
MDGGSIPDWKTILAGVSLLAMAVDQSTKVLIER